MILSSEFGHFITLLQSLIVINIDSCSSLLNPCQDLVVDGLAKVCQFRSCQAAWSEQNCLISRLNVLSRPFNWTQIHHNHIHANVPNLGVELATDAHKSLV